jgi:hypothetical protein
MTGRRLTGVLLTMAGAASVTVCLASASGGFRGVMQTDGGFCASGGLAGAGLGLAASSGLIGALR